MKLWPFNWGRNKDKPAAALSPIEIINDRMRNQDINGLFIAIENGTMPFRDIKDHDARLSVAKEFVSTRIGDIVEPGHDDFVTDHFKAMPAILGSDEAYADYLGHFITVLAETAVHENSGNAADMFFNLIAAASNEEKTNLLDLDHLDDRAVGASLATALHTLLQCAVKIEYWYHYHKFMACIATTLDNTSLMAQLDEESRANFTQKSKTINEAVWANPENELFLQATAAKIAFAFSKGADFLDVVAKNVTYLMALKTSSLYDFLVMSWRDILSDMNDPSQIDVKQQAAQMFSDGLAQKCAQLKDLAVANQDQDMDIDQFATVYAEFIVDEDVAPFLPLSTLRSAPLKAACGNFEPEERRRAELVDLWLNNKRETMTPDQVIAEITPTVIGIQECALRYFVNGVIIAEQLLDQPAVFNAFMADNEPLTQSDQVLLLKYSTLKSEANKPVSGT